VRLGVGKGYLAHKYPLTKDKTFIAKQKESMRKKHEDISNIPFNKN
jgi:hypothetical protein